MMDYYQRTFKEKPKQYTCALDPNDHPELDTSPKIEDPAKITIYLSMVGQLLWLRILGSFDFMSSVVAIATFCPMLADTRSRIE